MNSEKLTAEEMLQIASSQWATAKDIMKLGGVGRNKAYAIRTEIARECYNDNKIRNRRLVPMNEVLNYFDIKLDYLSIIDPVRESYDIVSGYISKCKASLLFYEGTNTDAVKEHKGDKIFYTQSDFVRKLTGKEIADIGVGGSVAHIITQFAVKLGCNPIIFVGQDFAFSNNKLHSDSTATEGKDNSIKQKDSIEVEAFGGLHKVRTNETLNLYRRQMEDLISKNKNTRFRL